MSVRAMEGTPLAELLRMAIPLCRQAQQRCPRTGPGRPPDYDDWVFAVLIMVAILKKRKSKSAQYRFLIQQAKDLKAYLPIKRLPARSTYFDRYHRAHRLFQVAIALQGEKALAQGVTTARTVAVDKSMMPARGPLWHTKNRLKGRIPDKLRGVDRDSRWGFSQHQGWIQGYSYEVVVAADKGGLVFPLLASASPADRKEHQSFGDKIEALPTQTRYVLADSGYDNHDFGERIEYDHEGKRTGRRFICPPNRRNQHGEQPKVVAGKEQQHRQQRIAFYRSPEGQQRYRRRGQTVEPFNEWFKNLFDLNDRVWHRGLPNNQTQLLAAIFGYQLFLRYNHRKGRHNGEIQWILDTI
jgi:hypothetical protein